MLAWEMRKAGVSLRLPTPGQAFWADPCDMNPNHTEVLDAAFVDDEAIAITAESPMALDAATD
eukprot:352199-Karenia_brevis.AAC.1